MTATAMLLAASAAAEGFDGKGENFSIEALEALGRVSAPTVSPDSKTVRNFIRECRRQQIQ